MLVLMNLFVLEVVIAPKLRVASSHRVGGFQQVIAEETIARLDQSMGGFDMEEFELQLSEVTATAQRKFLGAPPRKKKAPPKKDWDERITPEDTKELDEFLNSLARKGMLESAT